jgi:hypothetical protein
MGACENTLSFDLQVRPDSIAALHSYLEGIEGVGVVRTVDASRGLIKVWVAPDFQDEFRLLMESLRDVLEWRPVNPAREGLENSQEEQP